ncbi:MAG TPA: PepSY domain-containing protein [Acidobacteriaceae bacterium]
MSSSRTLLKASRLVHLYFGVFITPALIFFAFTGALQTFNLHESRPNSAYKPPAWLVTLAQIHKKQTPVAPQRRQFPRPGGAPDAAQKPFPSADQKPLADTGQRHGRGADQKNLSGDEKHGRGADQKPAFASSPAAPAPGADQKPELAQSPAAPAPATPARKHHPLPMKIFFLVASIGLFISSVTGLYMSWKYTRNHIAIALTLLAGIIVPVILAFV